MAMPQDELTSSKQSEPVGAASHQPPTASALSKAKAHLNARQFEEADAILIEAIKKSPEDRGLLLCYADVAQQSGKLQEALERWARVRVGIRDHAVGYSAGVQAHRQLGQYYAADALALDGLSRFPADHDLLINYAWCAHYAKNWPEAARRWHVLREHAPHVKEGFAQGAAALQQLGDVEAAEELLADALQRFPQDFELLKSRAALAYRAQDWTKAQHLWRQVRIAFPDERLPYLLEARALARLKAFEEAERTAMAGLEHFPECAELNFEAARCATQLNHHDVALERWEQAFRLSTHNPSVVIGYAQALSRVGSKQQADRMLEDLSARFPKDLATAIAWASHAIELGAWDSAELRWRAGHAEHAGNRAFAAAAHDAAMKAQLSGQDALADSLLQCAGKKLPEPKASGSTAADVRELDPRELLLHFESLGNNCELGLVQRKFGAEPIGLLRWTRIGPDALTTALTQKLEGVGEPEYTRLEANTDYVTVDTRYVMAMHTFIKPSQATPEEVLPKMYNRLQYLRRELLDDLRDAEKIFVYKALSPLSDEKIRRLGQSVASHGPNTLMVAQIADARNAPGSVWVIRPGLMVGYLDRISTDDPSFDMWLKICRKSYAIWRTLRAAAATAEHPAEAA
jgi:tetratricopeptide (TPR) repeat protein